MVIRSTIPSGELLHVKQIRMCMAMFVRVGVAMRFQDRLHVLRHVRYVWPERLAMWVAYHLPHAIVCWAAIRVIDHATSGRWSKQNVPNLGAMDAIKRWDLPNEPPEGADVDPKTVAWLFKRGVSP